jgi:hypothetical protein
MVNIGQCTGIFQVRKCSQKKKKKGTRRRPGEGTVYQRKDKRWVAEITQVRAHGSPQDECGGGSATSLFGAVEEGNSRRAERNAMRITSLSEAMP